MSSLLDQDIGESIGYAIRGESRQSASTKIRVMTDGVLLNMLRDDPELKGVDVVILDEFHERGVGSDTCLALLREVQCSLKEGLKIVVMSATLLGDDNENGDYDNEESMQSRLIQLLGGTDNCSVLQSEGRQYPIRIQYAPRTSPPLRALMRDGKLLVQTMTDAIEEGIAKAPEKGDVLAFLPGAKEIRKTVQELQSRKLDVDIFPLYGALPKAEQDRAIYKTQNRRRVIVSSPIAEASLTIEGVTCVVDSGLQRQPKYDSNTGLPHLVTVPCSKDSAVQRAGRAGRIREGYCLRLFSEMEHGNLSRHTMSEICSTDLVPTVLLLTEWGYTCANEMMNGFFLDSPPEESLTKAYQILTDLGAIEQYKLPNEKQKRYRVTKHGDLIASLPTHPRFATAIIKAADMGELELATAVTAAALTEDVVAWKKESNLGFNIRDLLNEGPNTYNGKQLINFASRLSVEAKSAVLNAMMSSERSSEVAERAGQALLFGFVDLIAQRKGDASYGGSTYMLSLGKSARLDGKPDEREYVIVIDTSTGDDSKTRIRSYCKIDASILRDVASEHDEVYTVASKGYEVRKRKVVKVGSVILSSSTLPSASSEETTEALCDAIETLGGVAGLLSLQPKKIMAEIEEFLDRISLAQQNSSDLEWPACFASIDAIKRGSGSANDEAIVLDMIEPWLGAASSLKGLDLLSILNSQLSSEQHYELDNFYPTKIVAPDGSSIPIQYKSETGPVAMAKLQQFFGQQESPRIGKDNTIPVSLSLLSPSGKPLAETIDLPFFWKETYPSVRAEMRGRYPKHPWPEDPLTAVATKMSKKQSMASFGGVEPDKRKKRRK